MKDPADHGVGQLMHDCFGIGCIGQPACETSHLFVNRELGVVDDGSDHPSDSVGRVDMGPRRGRFFGNELFQIGPWPAMDRRCDVVNAHVDDGRMIAITVEPRRHAQVDEKKRLASSWPGRQ